MDPFVEVTPAVSSSQRPPSATPPPLPRGPRPPLAVARPLSYANQHSQKDVVYPEKKSAHDNTAAAVSSTAAASVPDRNPSQSPRLASSTAPTPATSAAVPDRNTSQSHRLASSPTTPATPAAVHPVGPNSAAIAATYHRQSESVKLNVYDLHPYNTYLHGLGFGAYHSAVQIFGREYSFGFHDSSDTGVFSMLPKRVPNAVFRETVRNGGLLIEVGSVYLTFNQFTLILNQLKNDWRGNKYHLLKRNCNHFSKALLAALGLKAPSFINRLASAGDVLATVVPSFMLPKRVNTLIKTGRPDLMQADSDDDDDALSAIPSGNSGDGGVPTLSSSYVSGPDPGALISFHEDGTLDDESFAEFLKASELEYERSEQFKRLQKQTRQATAAAAAKNNQSRAKSTSKSSSSVTSPSGSPSGVAPLPLASAVILKDPPLTPAELESRVDRAMNDFALGSNVSEEEKTQIRAVLRMSISEGAQ